jgi:hypothetical protein
MDSSTIKINMNSDFSTTIEAVFFDATGGNPGLEVELNPVAAIYTVTGDPAVLFDVIRRLDNALPGWAYSIEFEQFV